MKDAWRLGLYLIKLGVIAGAILWLAQQEGRLSAELFGYRMDMPGGLFAALLILVILSFLVVGRFIDAFLHLPIWWQIRYARRQWQKGKSLLLEGLAAEEAGDIKHAGQVLKKLNARMPGDPFLLYFKAKLAAKTGNSSEAVAAYRAMTKLPAIAMTGEIGLFRQTLIGGDRNDAWQIGQKLMNARYKLPTDIVLAIVRLAAERRDWNKVGQYLGQLPGDHRETRKIRAAFKCEEARQAWKQGEFVAARKLAKAAVKVDPTFLPGKILFLKALLAQGKVKKALGQWMDDWHAEPHEALIPIFLELTKDRPATEVAASFLPFLKKHPGRASFRLGAQVAIAAELWGEAKHFITALHQLMTSQGGADISLYQLATKLAKHEGDHDLADQWLEDAGRASPSPTWLCQSCGTPYAEWALACQSCQSWDRIQWNETRHVASKDHLAAGPHSAALLPPIERYGNR